MSKYNKFESRKFVPKWNGLEDAKRGLDGSPDVVERQAAARIKAQDIFKKIKEGKL